MSQAHGIKETLEILSFMKGLAIGVESSMKDGKIDVFDMVHFLRVSPSLIAAVNGLDRVSCELKDLDSKERDMLLQEFQDVLSLFVRALKKGTK